MSSSIHLDSVSVQLGRVPILRQVSLQIAAGEAVALVGPSGSGKSTLLRLILGLLAPKEGRIQLGRTTLSDGQRIVVPPEARNLAVVFQDLALWPHLTVAGNLLFGLKARRVRAEERATRVREALRSVGLTNHANRYPGRLSGGEQQRVALARALVLDPSALLLDEPLSRLDPGLRTELTVLLRRSLEAHRLTALLVTHSFREARELTSRVVVLEHGSVVQTGSPEELACSPGTAFVQAFTRGD